MPLFFVSYRREDSAGHAGRLTDALETRFGHDSVFRDVDDIVPGEDFGQVITDRLEEVAAVLVLIGPGWLEAGGEDRRLDRADDFVRREIEWALASGKPVFPILIGDAVMPDEKALPPSIKGLSARHAATLRDVSWHADIDRLQQALERQCGVRSVLRSADRAGLPALAGRRRLTLGLSVVAALFVLLAAGWMVWLDSSDFVIDGEWHGQVTYPWGITVDERFQFETVDGTISGKAGFLGVPRLIEAGAVREGRIQFETRTPDMLGNGGSGQRVHRYAGTVVDGGIEMRLTSASGQSVEAEVRFVLARPPSWKGDGQVR